MYRGILQLLTGLALVHTGYRIWSHEPWDGVFVIATFEALIVGVLATIGYLLGRVWPTPWKYLHGQPTTVRVHRSTGETQVLTPTGWCTVDSGRHLAS